MGADQQKVKTVRSEKENLPNQDRDPRTGERCVSTRDVEARLKRVGSPSGGSWREECSNESLVHLVAERSQKRKQTHTMTTARVLNSSVASERVRPMIIEWKL